MKKKLVNFRPLFLIAITLLIATFFATKVCVAQGLKLTFFIVTIVGSLTCLCVLFFKKKRWMIVFGVCLMFASYPFLNVFIKGEKLQSYQILDTKVVSMTGVVDGSFVMKNGNISFNLSDVEVIDGNKTLKISGMLKVYVKPDNFVLEKDFRSGTLLCLSAKIDMLACQDDNLSKSFSFLSSDVIGFAYAQEDTVKPIGYYPKLSDKIHNFITNKLKALNLNNSEIARALLIGDTSSIDSETQAEFKITGIAHLLAVSGLHVSVIMMLISFILKKCKAKTLTNMCVTTALLFGYCYVCGFAISIIRASIMSIIGSYAIARGKPYDRISALSFASILTMLWSPLVMYNVSYQLSYIAVFSICCLMPVLQRLFGKYLKRGLTETIAIDVAIDIGMVAVISHYFGYVSLISIPANLILIPMASIAFIILVAGTLLSLIFPFMSFVIYGYDAIMSVVIQFNSWLANLGLILPLSVGSLAVVLTMLAMWGISDYLFISKKLKGIFTSLIVVGICLLLLI